MLKKALLTVLTVCLLTGCGYRMVITGTNAAFTIYPADIKNLSNEITFTSRFGDSVKMYLSSISALAQKDEAQFTGEFTLERFDTSGSAGGSSVSTVHAALTVLVTLYDKNGEEVFSRRISASENYDNTGSQPTTRTNRDEAAQKAIERIMTDFRHAFEQK